MTERRSLTEGLKATPTVDHHLALEKKFVFGEKEPIPSVVTTAPIPTTTNGAVVSNRIPISTRIRSDFAAALKRASLERQLECIEPNTLQDILEQAIEPWLKINGYLS